MPSGYRGLAFAALIAALLIAFGLGSFLTGLPNPQERYQPYQNSYADKNRSLSTVSNIAPAVVEKTPCDNPKSETESDLCAQWRAAKAAEKSANWTLYGVVASAIGISLLLWQIILTREAVKDTGNATKAMHESNRIARDIGEAQTRAHVSIKNAKCTITGNYITLYINAENSGLSPATDLKCKFFSTSTFRLTDEAGRMPKWSDADGTERLFEIGVCTANGGTQTGEFIWASLEALPVNFSSLMKHMTNNQCTLCMLFQGYIDWFDVFGKQQDIWISITCQQFEVFTDKMLIGECQVQHRILDVDVKLRELSKKS